MNENYYTSDANRARLAQIWEDAPNMPRTWGPADEVDGDRFDNFVSDADCDRAADAYEKGLGL